VGDGDDEFELEDELDLDASGAQQDAVASTIPLYLRFAALSMINSYPILPTLFVQILQVQVCMEIGASCTVRLHVCRRTRCMNQ
jgi:hypothetical protein